MRSYYLGAFGTVWLPYETRCKTCRTSAKFRATKWHRNFSQRMHQIHPIGQKTDVLKRFLLFGCTRDRLVALRNSEQNGPNKCKSSCHEVASKFFATNAPDPPHWAKLTFRSVSYYLGAFGTVWLPYETRCKKRADLVQKFVPRSRVGIFWQRTDPIHPIGP